MSEIPTADLTIPTMESTEEAFDIGKYGFSEEEYPELAGKSEGEVLSFIVQELHQHHIIQLLVLHLFLMGEAIYILQEIYLIVCGDFFID